MKPKQNSPKKNSPIKIQLENGQRERLDRALERMRDAGIPLSMSKLIRETVDERAKKILATRNIKILFEE
jgi:hypothetical protein